MSSQDQRQWIQRALERYEGPLLRYAAHLLGDLELARDVVQDTFLRLCSEQDPARLDGHLAQWLYTVCRNRVIDFHRKEKRMTALSPQQSAAQPSREPSQTAAVEQLDSAERVRRALASLPEREQELVRLKFEHNLSYREISRITDLSVGNVGYLLHTAIQRIRRNLQCSECSD